MRWWFRKRKKKAPARVLCGVMWSGSMHTHSCGEAATRYGYGKKHDGVHKCAACNARRGY